MSGWFFKKKTEDEDKLWNEAMSQMESGDYKKAIKKFSDFIELEPEKIDPYLMRGQAYVKLKKLNEAIKDFSKVLELNPDNGDAYYLRGQAYSLNGEFEKAVEDFKLTLEKIPLSPGFSVNKYSVHLSLGIELFKLGRYKEAEIHLEEVLAVSPNNETAQTIMKQIRQKVGPIAQSKGYESMEKKNIFNNSDKMGSLIHTAKHGPFFQKEAVKALGEMGDKRAIAPLVEILKNEFQSLTRQAAADSLEKLGWEPVNDTDKAYMLIAREKWKELAELGVEYLILALRWPNEREVMPYFVEVGKAAVEPLIKVLENKDCDQRSIAKVLGRLGDIRAAVPLAQILKDQGVDYDIKREVAEALNKLDFEPRNDTEKAYLLVAAKRWNEAAELGEPAVESLILVLRRLGWPEAREALAKIGKPAVEPLIQALGDPYVAWARFSAATALGKIGDKRAVKPLTQLLKNEKDEVIKEAIEKALEKIKTKM